MISLRDYQSEFKSDLRESLASGHKKIIACSSTGSGKSRVMASIARDALDKGRSVEVILPRKSLVCQLSRSFSELGIVNTVLMGDEPYYSQARCKIISIHTYLARLRSGKIGFIGSDLLMLDEQQLMHTPSMVELFNKYKTVVAFTATPTAKKRFPLSKLYTEIVEAISMQELTDMGYLVPLRYFAPADFHPENVRTDVDGEYLSGALNNYIDGMLKNDEGKAMLVGDIYANWLKLASDRQTVIFCKTQAHASAVCDEFNGNGVKSLYVDCHTSDDEREFIFEQIENKSAQVIVNCSIVSVGVDIPVLSCAVLATPDRKLDKYLQKIGRLTRPDPDSGKVDAVVIDHCGCVARLGMATDVHIWSLDGKETVEELTKKAKEEKNEAKEVTCRDCSTVYKGQRKCPECGLESIQAGETIPCHEAELKEVKSTPMDKRDFYAQLLGYCKEKGKNDSYALAMFRNKYGAWPHAKKSVQPISPGQEVLNYIRSRQIAYSKRRPNG